jgi:RimJ/RimL family protein N-acetyltransferase
MEIVRLGPDDAVRFVVMRQTALTEGAASFRTSAADDAKVPLAAWAQRLAQEHVYAVQRDGEWLAIGGLSHETRSKLAHKGLVWGMYTAPAARGTGAAARILDQLEAAARELGLRQLQLTLMADNARARRVYERHGYVLYAIEPDSIRREDGSYADEALMWKRL